MDVAPAQVAQPRNPGLAKHPSRGKIAVAPLYREPTCSTHLRPVSGKPVESNGKSASFGPSVQKSARSRVSFLRKSRSFEQLWAAAGV